MGIDVAYVFQHNKVMYDKPLANIIASKTIKCLKNKFNQHGELYIHWKLQAVVERN